MFYNKYGIFWKDVLTNFNEYFDYYCYLRYIHSDIDYIEL